ncbi:MAG: aspartate/methionine/tyrosine aminotransferase [Gammaproteobacteria bacterium]|jgi:aspartate/methionine/tyrosine aminotransferase
MSPQLPTRIRAIQAPVVPIIAGLIAEHPGTISLGQGVVHYGPPAEAAQVFTSFMDEPRNHLYTPDWGMAPLVSALTEKLRADNGIDMSGKSVVVTAGANMGFLNSMLAITDPGDEVIILAPYYFNHEMAIRLAGCTPIIVSTTVDLTPDLKAIEAAIGPRTRAVVTVSPNNPTGVTYPPATLSAVNALCGSARIFHISDEAYEYFVYDDARHHSPASDSASAEHTVSLFSLSKSYGFAGWRVGYMVVPDALFEPVMKVQDTNVICAPVISQHAALTCLQAGREYSAGFMPELVEVRGLVLAALEGLGNLVTVPAANGAFYVYLRVNADLDAFELARRLIVEHQVAVIPGTAFGSHDGCYLRVSYGALKKQAVNEGIGRLVDGLARIGSARLIPD